MNTSRDGASTSPAKPSPGKQQPTNWRVNHPEEAGGPAWLTVEPSPKVVADYLKIGVTITELYEGAAVPDPSFSTNAAASVLVERARVAGKILTSLGELDHFANEPHWRRDITNVKQLLNDIGAFVRRMTN